VTSAARPHGSRRRSPPGADGASSMPTRIPATCSGARAASSKLDLGWSGSSTTTPGPLPLMLLAFWREDAEFLRRPLMLGEVATTSTSRPARRSRRLRRPVQGRLVQRHRARADARHADRDRSTARIRLPARCDDRSASQQMQLAVAGSTSPWTPSRRSAASCSAGCVTVGGAVDPQRAIYEIRS
jgi:hypothetical protein